MKKEQVVKMKVGKGAPNADKDGIRDLNISSLDRRPLADYYRMAGKFVNVENHVYYDMAMYQGAQPVTQQHTAELFTRGMSEPGICTNTGDVIGKKGEFWTNMVTDGEFDNSTSFLLEMIAVDLFITSESPTTSAFGAITMPHSIAVAGHSATNMYKAISRQFKIAFKRSEQVMVSGPLYEFPSPFVASGAIGASVGGFIQNGFSVPGWNKLSEIHALQSNDRFSVEVIPMTSTFTPTIPFEIRVLFIGKRIQTLYA